MAGAAFLALAGQAHAQESAAELARKLANPVANLISVPLQNNYDCCYGPSKLSRYTLNIQPVVPLSLNEDWNLIVRTILPIIYQEGSAPGAASEGGLGDTVQSFFVSPQASKRGVTWAAGPVFLYPTGEAAFSAETWGAGPSVLLLKQSGDTTAGLLANHIWSFAGEETRPDVSASLFQPFYTYTRRSSTAFSISSEATYDWRSDQWVVPVIAGVSHVYKFGQQRVQLGVLGKVYLESPHDGPDWGVRFNAVFLFPKR